MITARDTLGLSAFSILEKEIEIHPEVAGYSETHSAEKQNYVVSFEPTYSPRASLVMCSWTYLATQIYVGKNSS